MKKLLLLFLLLFTFTACTKDNPIVTEVTLNTTTVSLTIDDTYQLKVSYQPSDLQSPSYQWISLDASIATVDNQGKITAKNLGTTTITVNTENNLKASCSVTVTPIQATSIKLNKENLTLIIGEEDVLTCEITPSNTTNKEIIWSTSDDKIVSVDKTGKIKAIGVGQTQIKAMTSNSVHAICNVTINPIKLKGIVLSETIKIIEETDSFYLSVNFNPIDATNQNIKWESSNTSIATVSESGSVIGVTEGVATITATSEDGEYKATCEIIVTKIKVKSITINPSDLTLAIGEVKLLTPEILPINAANKNVSWVSSNPSVATVDEYGYVYAQNIGTAVITATTNDGGYVGSAYINTADIADLIIIEAYGRRLMQTTLDTRFTLNSRITNPTNMPITLASVMLINSDRHVLEIQDGGKMLVSGLSHINIFNELLINNADVGGWIGDIVSTYKVIYQFRSNGKNYQVEKNFEGGVWGSLN